MEQNEWEKKFDELWGGWPENKDFPTQGMDAKLRTFIAEQRQKARESTVKDLKDTLGVLEMSGRKTIKIADVRYFLDSSEAAAHPRGE